MGSFVCFVFVFLSRVCGIRKFGGRLSLDYFGIFDVGCLVGLIGVFIGFWRVRMLLFVVIFFIFLVELKENRDF